MRVGRWLWVLGLMLLFDGLRGCAPREVREPVQEKAASEQVAEVSREPAAERGTKETASQEAPSEPRRESKAEGPRDEPSPTEPAPREAPSEPRSEDGGEPSREPSDGSEPGAPDRLAEKLPEPSAEKPPTHFPLLGQTIKFTDPKQGPYPQVKICAHLSIGDVELGKPLTGTSCAVSPTDGKYSIPNVPYSQDVYISFRSNGPNSPSKDLLPTVLAIHVAPGQSQQHLWRLRTELVDKSESALIAQLLQVKLDLAKKGVLVTDVHTQRIKTVTGVTMKLYPSQPAGTVGPIYMPASLPGAPSTTGTTVAGLALFLNIPPGTYSVSYTKKGVASCGAYPTSPATTSPCRAGAVSGKDDCSVMKVLAGWLSISSGTCP